MILPSAFIVALSLLFAAVAQWFSPMPTWVRRLKSLAFALVSAVYFAEGLNLMDMHGKAFTLRYSLIVLSLVVIITIVAWRVGGGRSWNKD